MKETKASKKDNYLLKLLKENMELHNKNVIYQTILEKHDLLKEADEYYKSFTESVFEDAYAVDMSNDKSQRFYCCKHGNKFNAIEEANVYQAICDLNKNCSECDDFEFKDSEENV